MLRVQVLRKTAHSLTARLFPCLRAAGQYETTNGIKVSAHGACAAPLVRQVFTQQTREPTSVKTAAAVRQETAAAGGGALKTAGYASQTGPVTSEHVMGECQKSERMSCKFCGDTSGAKNKDEPGKICIVLQPFFLFF